MKILESKKWIFSGENRQVMKNFLKDHTNDWGWDYAWERRDRMTREEKRELLTSELENICRFLEISSNEENNAIILRLCRNWALLKRSTEKVIELDRDIAFLSEVDWN